MRPMHDSQTASFSRYDRYLVANIHTGPVTNGHLDLRRAIIEIADVIILLKITRTDAVSNESNSSSGSGSGRKNTTTLWKNNEHIQ